MECGYGVWNLIYCDVNGMNRVDPIPDVWLLDLTC
jgi:hypothetical protein